jgi:hypothetical protein
MKNGENSRRGGAGRAFDPHRPAKGGRDTSPCRGRQEGAGCGAAGAVSSLSRHRGSAGVHVRGGAWRLMLAGVVLTTVGSVEASTGCLRVCWRWRFKNRNTPCGGIFFSAKGLRAIPRTHRAKRRFPAKSRA